MTAMRRQAMAGFTLLEVLIATALLALLFLGALSALDSGGRGWQNLNRQIEKQHEVASVVDLLRQLFEGAYPSAIANSQNDWQVAFTGSSTTVEFATLPPPALSGAGPLRVRLQADEASGLSLAYAPDRHQASLDAAQLTAVSIATRVTALRFSYWGDTPAGAAPAWQESWRGRRALPRLVRVEIAADGRPPTAHFFAPRLTADATCLFNVVSKRCTGR